MTRRRDGVDRCALCCEWFEASLCGQVGSYDVCHGCIAYLHETTDSDHPLGDWDVERARDAATRWHEHATREATP